MDLRDAVVNDFPHLEQTVLATAALVSTVSRMTDDDVHETSVLPGWNRGHVITHLARNADALAHVLRGAQVGEVRPQYPSMDKREADIQAGAGKAAASLLQDLVAACGRWEVAARALETPHFERLGARLPEGPTYPVRKVGLFRRTEVEVHHADLDAGYSAHDWPDDLVAALMGRRRKELARDGVRLRWTATDTGETWETGPSSGPEITGSAADILWWLLGRGTGEVLTCSDGPLPTLGRWA